MNVHIEAPNLDKLAAEFGATEKQVEVAMRRAVSRTTRWASFTGIRAVAEATGLQMKVVKGRVAVSIRQKEGRGRVFIGLNPISLSRLSPVQTKTGVRSGPANIAGAFLTNKFGKNVFKRAGASRLPIEKQTYEIGSKSEEALQGQVISKIAEKLQAEFEHELKWASH